jgi:hypothetical protein
MKYNFFQVSIPNQQTFNKTGVDKAEQDFTDMKTFCGLLLYVQKHIHDVMSQLSG